MKRLMSLLLMLCLLIPCLTDPRWRTPPSRFRRLIMTASPNHAKGCTTICCSAPTSGRTNS